MTRPRVLLVKFDKPPGGPMQLSYSEPIGLCYISAYLQERGIDCRLCHLFGKADQENIINVVNEYQPDIIGFSVRNFNYDLSVEKIMEIRELFPSTKIVLGGECITQENAKHICQSANTDAVFVSDGEESFYRYVVGENLDQIPGIVFLNSQGEYIQTSGPQNCLDVTKLPMMARDGLPMGQYHSDGFTGLKYASMHVQRGCRFRCTFCHTAIRYKSVASRTVEQILQEIDFLIDEFQIEAIAIFDEDFFADLERVKGIIDGLEERNNPIFWHSFMKLTDLQEPEVIALLPKLRKTGYIRSIVGLESFVPSTLKSYHKRGALNTLQLCQNLTDNDISLCPSYIIGAPHETEEDVAFGLNKLYKLKSKHRLKMDFPYVSFIIPFPGTALTEEYEKEGLIIDRNWSHYDGENVTIKSKCSPEKLLKLRDQFYADYNKIH